jgi:hypothetical protein
MQRTITKKDARGILHRIKKEPLSSKAADGLRKS